MNRLTRKTNGKDYCTHCRYIEKTNELFGRGEKPLAPNEYYKQEPYKIEDSYYEEDILVKLGRLEDLEEELGCPLDVIFKALDNGIIINEDGYINTAYENEKFNEEEDSYYDNLQLYKSNDGYYFEETDSPYGDLECGLIGCEVALKDYQKTWWLKGEK